MSRKFPPLLWRRQWCYSSGLVWHIVVRPMHKSIRWNRFGSPQYAFCIRNWASFDTNARWVCLSVCRLIPCRAWSTSSTGFLIRIDCFCLCIPLHFHRSTMQITRAQNDNREFKKHFRCVTLTMFIVGIGVRWGRTRQYSESGKRPASHSQIFILQKW